MSKSKAITKPLEEQETSALANLAVAGDKDACKAFYARLDAEGCAETTVEALTGNACRVRNIRHENPVINEAFRRKIEQMREDLGVQSASALEKLLIERVVLCWFHLQEIETGYATHMKGSVSMEKATYLQKSLDRAEARYQAAIKSLAVVRRLQLPAVKVNIEKNQINVAQIGTEGVSVLSEEKQGLLT